VNLTHVHAGVAGRRLASLCAASALVIALALATAGSALAEPTYLFAFDNSPAGPSSVAIANIGAGDGGSHAYRVDVTRNGTPLASTPQPAGWPGAAVGLAGPLQAGDVATLFTDGAPTTSRAYDGAPTIGTDACTGAVRFTGAMTPGADLRVSTGASAGSAGTNSATVASTGGTYTATLSRALVSGDRVDAFELVQSGDAQIQSSMEATVGACLIALPPATTTTPTTTTPPTPPAVTAAQVLSALHRALGHAAKQLSSVDPRTIAARGLPKFTFRFLEPGRTTFRMTAPAAATIRSAFDAKAKKKARKPVTIASATVRRTAAGNASVRLKLTKAGRRLLKRVKRIRVTLTAAFAPADHSKAQSAVTRFTLKRKAAKKTHKK
jgi:hypothetical protein